MGKYHVHYSGRAFHQDASNAMKGDIVRGLVELITNSDDSYGDDPNGKIRIEVEHRRNRPWRVVVRDRAKGMSKERMQEAIGGLGERSVRFESGASVRDNLGRGAKDLAAFGPVTFESICDGHYARLTLEPDGSYDEPIEQKVTSSQREVLGIPHAGTVVTVNVEPRFRCPQHRTLIERLSSHYQLRDINSDRRREITLVDLNSNDSDGVRYSSPVLPEVLTRQLEIDDYPEASATLTIYRHAERHENPSSDPSRPEGIIIKGRRAIYENSLFSFEGNPHAHWFTGVLNCPHIDHLATEYDRRFAEGVDFSPLNNIPIITRSRDGLEHDHPFFKSLARSVDEVLGNLVKAEEDAARQGEARESTRMRRTLDALGRELGQLVDADLREIEEDGLDGGRGHLGEEPVWVIPESPVLYMGENKTLAIVAMRSLGESEVSVDADPEGVVELIDGQVLPFIDHPRREELLIARLRLRPLIEDEETYLTIRCGEHESLTLVQVRPEREIPDLVPPERFQFERERYKLSLGKRRKLLLLAPVDVVDVQGSSIAITSSSPDAVVLGGHTELEFDEELVCYVGQVEVDPRRLGGMATLTATLGSLKTTCEVVVAQHEDRGPNIEIKIVDEAGGKYRALVEREDDRTIIKIQGGHPAIRRYLGPGPEFPNQDQLSSRLVIAEIVAGEASRMIMEKKYSTARGA